MAEHVSDPDDLAAEVHWYMYEAPRQGAYVRVTMRNRHTGAFLAEGHEDELNWRYRPNVLAAERKALDFAARVALGLLHGAA